jgi:catechol 2,3-dioxygenase-like lactoylglutathione lyase family enzyme
MNPLVTTLMGVTLSVPDIEDVAHKFCQALGWRRLAEGLIEPREERAWSIAPGQAGHRHIILGATAARRGFLRLVSGREPEATALELRRGGWSSIEFVVQNVDVVHERLKRAEGFSIVSPPESVDLTDAGSLLHRAFVARGPRGLSLIFTQALGQPVKRDFPVAAYGVGMIFNVVLRTDAIAQSRMLYVERLGMEPFLDTPLQNENFNSLLKLPPGTTLQITMVKGAGPGTGEGSIELQGYGAGLLETPAVAPDQFPPGLAMVTYTARDVEAAYQAAVAAGVEVFSKPVAIESSLYGGGRSFVLRGPTLERLEIIERPWAVY